MSFDSGSISFRRFAVVGPHIESITQDILDTLAAHTLRSPDIGVPELTEYGFCGGRHILDNEFSFDRNVFADCLSFALRIDTNKIPADVQRAHLIIEEEAAAKDNPSGFISKVQKKDAKDAVRRKLEEDLRAGRFRSTKMLPILWDFEHRILYTAANPKQFELLAELFERAFNLSLQPLTAGSLALRLLEPDGRRRDYEDFKPTRFIIGPDGESQFPDYPWTLKSPEPKDFLGNEFLLWMWFHSETSDEIRVREPSGSAAGSSCSLVFEKSLDLDCAYAQTGKVSVRSTAPARMPETRHALRTGKLPRKAGLLLEAHRQEFSFTLNPESFTLSSTKLPQVEDAETPRAVFEERITLLRDLCNVLDSLFNTFLLLRASATWESQTASIRRWILQSAKPITAVA